MRLRASSTANWTWTERQTEAPALFVEGMAEVVAVQVESLLDMAWTAWTLRNESFELDEACLNEIPRQEGIRRLASGIPVPPVPLLVGENGQLGGHAA